MLDVSVITVHVFSPALRAPEAAMGDPELHMRGVGGGAVLSRCFGDRRVTLRSQRHFGSCSEAQGLAHAP